MMKMSDEMFNLWLGFLVGIFMMAVVFLISSDNRRTNALNDQLRNCVAADLVDDDECYNTFRVITEWEKEYR